jgi:hypothetical protein
VILPSVKLLYKKVKLCRPPLWSSGQSSSYRSKGPGFDSRALQGLKTVVGLERGPLSLVSTTEELLGRNNSGFGLET